MLTEKSFDTSELVLNYIVRDEPGQTAIGHVMRFLDVL